MSIPPWQQHQAAGPPSGAQVAGGVGLATATNLITAFTPTVQQALTGHQGQVGGPEVVGIAAFINLTVQGSKHWKWLDQDRYVPWIILALGVAVAMFVFRDPIKALLNGATAGLQSWFTYHGLSNAGMAPSSAAPYSGANPAVPEVPLGPTT